MSSSRRMIKALAALLPLGAMGASAALAATPAKPVDGAATQRGVAERLQAIRGAVSQLTDEAARLEPGDPNVQKVQWLNWGAPGWRNGGWNNWRNGWHNGGWNNWNNGWQNGGWHNWHNGWRNW